MEGITKERLRVFREHCQNQSDLELYDYLLTRCEVLNPWQPIETAPKDMEIWLYNEHYKSVGRWNTAHNDWVDSANCFMAPTNWQELPEDPK